MNDVSTPGGALLATLAGRFPAAEFTTSLGDPVARVGR